MEKPGLQVDDELARLEAQLSAYQALGPCAATAAATAAHFPPAAMLALPLSTVRLLLERARQLDEVLADHRQMRAALIEIAEAVGPLRCCGRFERCCGLRVPAAADAEALQERAHAALQGTHR